MIRERLLAHIGRFLSTVGAEELYLFGSCARADHLDNSDVDLVVISDAFAGVLYP